MKQTAIERHRPPKRVNHARNKVRNGYSLAVIEMMMGLRKIQEELNEKRNLNPEE